MAIEKGTVTEIFDLAKQKQHSKKLDGKVRLDSTGEEIPFLSDTTSSGGKLKKGDRIKGTLPNKSLRGKFMKTVRRLR